MNVEEYCGTGNSNSYVPHPVSTPGDFDNFLQKYVKGEEEEDDKKDEGLIDYLLEALKGREKELRMEGNSYMNAEVKLEYLQNHFPGLFNSQEL
jgi:hypothetical protein